MTIEEVFDFSELENIEWIISKEICRIVFLIILFVSLIAIYLILFLNQDKLLKSSNDIINFHAGVLSSFGIC